MSSSDFVRGEGDMCIGIGGVESTLEQLSELIPEEARLPLAVTGAVLAVTAMVVTCALRPHPPVLEARVLSLHVRDTFPVSADHGVSEVVGPHWDHHHADAAKPAVVSLGAPLVVDVTIRVTRSERCPPRTRLRGVGTRLRFDVQDVPTAVGEHTKRATIDAPFVGLQHEVDSVDWSLTVDDDAVPIGRTRHDVYAVFADSRRKRDDTSSYGRGVWVDVLDLLFRDANIRGCTTRLAAATEITRYCHNHDEGYASGGHYELDVHPSQGYPAKIFRLLDYLDCRMGRVNCADQAQAVTALCHAVGIPMRIVALEPFGYIKPTRIVGILGPCNNPRPTGSDADLPHELASPEQKLSHLRWGFFRHVFCLLGELIDTAESLRIGMMYTTRMEPSEGAKVFDACAGPCLGMDLSEYVEASIDAEAHEMRAFALKNRKVKATERAPEACGRAAFIRPEYELFGLRLACPVCGSEDLETRRQHFRDYMNLDETDYRCRGCGESFMIAETRKG